MCTASVNWWNYLKVWFCDESFQNMFTNRPKTVGKTVANGEKNRSMTFPTFSNVNWLHISCADYMFTKHSITIVFVWLLWLYFYDYHKCICIKCIWLFTTFLHVNWQLSCADYSQNIPSQLYVYDYCNCICCITLAIIFVWLS